ncbi:hypothetical protein OHC33_006113 [Knufia fluminis]|uniref:Uncharacterized protein n=1 Tax=Knufia fluminis TaxID=191047 RepID=A0AAN8EKN4_9EURO|nr:hypothetical protein OHC33_006113 [Knufia fluminis]
MAKPLECDEFRIPGLVEIYDDDRSGVLQAGREGASNNEHQGEQAQCLKVLKGSAGDAHVPKESFAQAETVNLGSRSGLQLAFLMLLEQGEPVRGPLDGILLRLEHCRTRLDIYATIVVHLSCAFPKGEPSPSTVDVTIHHTSRSSSSKTNKELTPNHHVGDIHERIWEDISLVDDMSGFADVPLISVDFKETGHLDTSPPKPETKAYNNFQHALHRHLEKRSSEPLGVPLSFFKTSMRHVARIAHQLGTERLQLEKTQAEEVERQEHTQSLEDELRDTKKKLEGAEEQIRALRKKLGGTEELIHRSMARRDDCESAVTEARDMLDNVLKGIGPHD